MKKTPTKNSLLRTILIVIIGISLLLGLVLFLLGQNNLWLMKKDEKVATLSPYTNPIAITVPVSPEVSDTVETCTNEYFPVCGNNGVTYPTRCHAGKDNMIVAYSGECLPSQENQSVQTGSISFPTDTGGVTAPEAQKPTTPLTEICTREYAPVCGNNGVTYPNDCMAGTTVIAHIGECTENEKKFLNLGAYIAYENPRAGYSLFLPKYVYYAGAGSQDGATHALMVAMTATGTDVFSLAPVQVWFYKYVPANPPSDISTQTENGIIYVKNNDSTGNPKIGNIIQSILESAR